MEERKEYIEEQKEKNLVMQSAHRATSKPAWRTKGPNGEVITWPALPNVKTRLQYITSGYDTAEIAQKIGSTRRAVYQQFGRAEKLSKTILAKYAQAFGCPLMWLQGKVKKSEEIEQEEPAEECACTGEAKESAVCITINGVFDIAKIMQVLPQGGVYRAHITLDSIDEGDDGK